jgi:xanthine dehydrogenase molybdenum-binding subunit
MMPLEPLTVVTGFEPSGELTIWMPCQRPMTFAKKIAQVFGIPEGKVNLVCEYAGGFFGESNWTPLPICVALAQKSHRPVKLEFTREETVLNSASREVYIAKGAAGFEADGTLCALKEELIVDSGAYFNRSSACTMVGMSSFSGLYRCANVSGEAKAVYSNVPMASGARGYGGPAAFFLLEQLMDEAAEKLGMDPVALRLKNAKQLGDFGHAFPLETATLASVIETGAEKIGWAEKKQRDRVDAGLRRGVGMAAYYDVSGGQPFERFDRNVEMQLGEDGPVTAIFNHPDGGMNLLGTMAQITAEVLGVAYEDVHFVTASTEGKLFDAGMAGNSGLYTVGNAIVKAASALRERILAEAAGQLELAAGDLVIRDGAIYAAEDDKPLLTLSELANKAIYEGTGASRSIAVVESYHPTANPNPFGAVFADVAVDVETGDVKVEKLVLVHDIGRAINPTTVEGQLEGGMSLGVGYALFEDASIDPETGALRGDNFNTYRLPSTLDLPEMEVVLWEEPAPSGPFGGKGVGMCGVIGIAPAIANAIYDAVGVRLTELPMTPERVLAAIKSGVGLDRPGSPTPSSRT